ncbi:MAG TPA: phosphatidylserine decarboxylase [Phycisphaerae bacterium]|nr:phosphatidylserine decarboxylase [Phycisphaerae bacterium]
MPLTRDGLRELLISTATFGVGGGAAVYSALAFSPRYWLLAAPLVIIWVFTLSFFRDPDRTVPAGAGLLVAPADGKVTEITPLDSYEGIDGPALRIGIFLSIFDVHINRSPCDGRVAQTNYQAGQFLDARHKDSGHRNEANTIIIEPQAGTKGPIVVRQVAGLIARRIVCHVGPGSMLRRGQQLGMIKFGSRTELIVPADGGFKAAVKVNDHVRAGTTVIMRVAGSAEE